MTNDSDTGSIVAEATRELIATDGGDVTVVSSSSSEVTLQLILKDAVCEECVMPAAFLTQVVLNVAKKKIPQLETVRIIDPRVDL
tara:strand:+ start:8551 stop:8805 length:255 start_codon:yes stop_codon:yes gene_type:complete